MVDKNIFGGIYNGKKVLLTGHTGFKGSWMAFWLHLMGAEVHGIALDPPSEPNHINCLPAFCSSNIIDIRDFAALEQKVTEINPDIIFHLAAQPLVRLSYDIPVETFHTNIMGTIHLLEIARKLPNLKALVSITSDKCYKNNEWLWGYRENEPMGGDDPYSASKGCAELVTHSYQHSFFNKKQYGKTHNVLIASVRAGNVIGGGDWAKDRIVPDLVKAAHAGTALEIRNPNATRPWQHVLEPISGYLTLGWQLLLGKVEYAEGWNFGPESDNNVPVIDLVSEAKKHWTSVDYFFSKGEHPHEANFLMLDSTKAKKLLKWKPVWGLQDTIRVTINWYKAYYNENAIITEADIVSYINDAKKLGVIWTNA